MESRQLTQEDESSAEIWQESGESRKSVKVENKSKNKNKTKFKPIPIRANKRKLPQIESNQMENDQSTEVNSNYLDLKKNKMNKEEKTFNDINDSTGLYHCQLCGHGVPTIKKLLEHSKTQHPGETYHCLEEGCPFKTENYYYLRTHYYKKKFQPVKTKNSNTNTSTSLEIVEENEEHSIKKKIKGFSCPYDSCSFVIEVTDFDLEEEEALATLYQHEGEVHFTPREHRRYQLLFHDISQGEIEEEVEED